MGGDMPYRPKSMCSMPGCTNRSVSRGRCASHPRNDDLGRSKRMSASQQGYGVAWRRLRESFLKRFPDCAVPGCSEKATQVDHITPKAKGGTDDESNLQGLCASHHSQKTVMVDGGFGKKAR